MVLAANTAKWVRSLCSKPWEGMFWTHSQLAKVVLLLTHLPLGFKMFSWNMLLGVGVGECYL